MWNTRGLLIWLSIPSAACALMCNCTCNPTFPKCSHHVTDDNVRASPPLNRAYEHSPSAPTRSLRLQALVWSLGPIHGVEREAMRRDVPCLMLLIPACAVSAIATSAYCGMQNQYDINLTEARGHLSKSGGSYACSREGEISARSDML